MHQRFSENAQSRITQSGPCGNHIGDQIGDAKLNGRFDGAVKVHGFRVDAMLDQIVVYELVECGGDSLAFNILKLGNRRIVRGCETERGGSEAKLHMLLRIGAGVHEQIMPGDSNVDGAATDIDRNVEGTQVEQLNIIVGILHDQLARVAPQTVAASASMFQAGSDSMPLLGTAILSMFLL